ncbi:MAG: hypothetical protein PUJ57_02050 [Peptoniphilaceae bacterium]|nr:hypothetical protein [Peptoniphilaceae bacterium]
MERLNRAYEDEEVQNLYEHCSSARKIFKTPLERTMEQWFAIPYKGLDYRNEEQQMLTKHGESVRSKSEKIIADRLISYGIPYKNG